MTCAETRLLPESCRRRPLTSAEQAVFAGELVDFCLERLAYFKAPGYVAICERLPLTPTEKIQGGFEGACLGVADFARLRRYACPEKADARRA